MKSTLLILSCIVIFTSCGPSESEVKQKIVDVSIANVCDCYDANKSDWLAYQQCKERIQTGRILLEDDAEGLTEFEVQIKECDQYFKD